MTALATAPAVAALADSRFEAAIAQLSAYLRHPAISCDPAHHGDLRALAQRIRADLAEHGFEDAAVVELPEALPLVAASWMGAGPDRPTVLIYGHFDLQPVKGEPWSTPPHEATRKGDRLYARGAADDMGGWVSHLVALAAWREGGGLPCNIRLVIEGEEEIGSPNLERYMDAYPELFDADVMVLTDCENPSVDLPGLTVSLRGLMEVELRCEALTADVHSGLWGNMAPDASVTLCRLIASLVDEDGRLAVGRCEVEPGFEEKAAVVPLTDEVICGGAHVAEGLSPLPTRGRTPAEWLWRQPALTVVSTTLPTADRKKNALRTTASATLSVRLGASQRGEVVYGAIREHLLAQPTGGCRVTVTATGWNGQGWLYEPQGPAFEAADRAYTRAWGHPLVRVGIGGSIPFVALFGRRYGDLPLILNGVMDPQTTAHGPDESLHLGVFRKAIAANVWLYAELAELGKSGVKTG